jgi:pimeloyl-ACP methyl ester carboxylesterase
VKGRALGIAAFAVAAAGGAAMGWAGERRAVRHQIPEADPDWQELRRPIKGEQLAVESFDSTHLAVEMTGPRSAPVLILAHGYGMSMHAWHYQRRELADEFRVVVFDHRGHGRSEEAESGDYSVEAFGRDLSAVIEATVPPGESTVVVGHSMGGMTVLSYVEQYPESVHGRLAGAVLMSTSGSDVVTGGMLSVGMAAATGLGNRLTRRAFQTLGRRAGYADLIYSSSTDLSFLLTKLIGLNSHASSAHVAFTEQLMLDCPNTVKAAIGPIFTSLDMREAAPLLKVPALVMVGELDRVTPPRQAQRLMELLPDADLMELPGIGHMAPLEAHQAVTAHIRAFARRVMA